MNENAKIIIGVDHYKENKSSLTWDKDYDLELNTLSIKDNKQMVVPMSGGILSKDDSFHSSSGYLLPGNLKLASDKGSILVPSAVLFLGLYFGSIWKSFYDIDEANQKLVRRFTGRVTKKLSISKFMDYEIPEFIIK